MWTDELAGLARDLERAGGRIEISLPDGQPLRVGAEPAAARVLLRSPLAARAASRRDHLALAEAYLDGEVEIEGDWHEALRATLLLDLEPDLLRRLRFAVRLLLPRRGWNERGIGFHYDRPAEFFLPWFERWRSYSHGFYESPGDPPAEAQERKLRFALDALALAPGARVLDVGVGWGAFLEYAGLRGVRVHGITLSQRQRDFVAALIRERSLPCSVECVDFFDYAPQEPFDGAVFMGSLEHLIDVRAVARFLQRNLRAGGRVYADFVSQRERFRIGAFLARHVWRGPAAYVCVPRLLDALLRSGLSMLELRDDTQSYAYTVRDWADALERAAPGLVQRFGRREVRTFQLYLRASEFFLASDRTQAYHLVAARG